MNGLYKLNFDCGRQGQLEGIFIADVKFVDYLIENDIYVDFGEVLGKHSDICGTVGKDEIEFVTDNHEVLTIVKGFDLENGHNPFEYPVAHWEMDVDPDLDFDDWTVYDYINWKLNDEFPTWMEK